MKEEMYFDRNSLLHADFGAAIIRKSGYRSYYKHGLLNRTGGAAIEYADGSSVEYYENGLHHRVGAPARMWKSGVEGWYLNGERHRTDGAARTYADGTKAYYLFGYEVSEENFNQCCQMNRNQFLLFMKIGE